jgi:hypothetical protein
MDLKDFVASTLTQITQGVSEAQSVVRSSGGLVNPAMTGVVNRESYFGSVETGQHVFLVDFDVAVVASEATGTHAGAKLEVASILSLGVGGKSDAATQSTSRIKFKVPIALPVDAEAKRALDERLRREQAESDAAIARHNRGERI